MFQLAGDDLERVVAAGCGGYVVAVAFQDPAGDLAHGGFVLDHQHRLAVAVLRLAARAGRLPPGR